MSGISRLGNKIYDVLGLDAWGQREIIPNDFNTEIIETNQAFGNATIDASKIKSLTVDTITVSTTGFIKSGKTSFTDSTNAGWFQSALGIYYGSAGDASYLKYTIGTGALDIKGSITTGVGSVINGTYVDSLSVSKLAAGTITSKAITLAVAAGTGNAYIAAGKTQFDNTQTGFILGINDAVAGDPPQFFIGNTTTYLNWDGSNVIIKAGTGSSIDFGYVVNGPPANATVGANWNTNLSNIPASATASYITSTKITSTTIESPTITAGTITGTTVQTSQYTNTGIKMSSGLDGLVVYGQTITFKDTSGNTRGYLGSDNGTVYMIGVSDKNIQLGSYQDIVLDAAQYCSVRPNRSGVGLGASDYPWSTVVANSFTIGNNVGYSLSKSSNVLVANGFTNFSISGSTFRPVGFTFKDGSNVNRYIVVLATGDPA